MGFRPSHAFAFSAVFIIAACGSTAPPPPPASTPAPLTTPAPTSGSSCLMTHICGCNLGCAKISIDAASLKEGTRATAQSGPYAGKEMIVLKEPDTTGASVFTLSDRERNYPCELPRESKSLMGFACAAKDSGPIPANACAKGCD